MDNDDIIYAERLLEILKGKPRLISTPLYEQINAEFKGRPIRQFFNYDHILKELEKLGLIEIKPLNKKIKQIFLLEKRELATSFKDELAKSIAIQAKKAKKENLELEHLKLQVWTAKN